MADVVLFWKSRLLLAAGIEKRRDKKGQNRFSLDFRRRRREREREGEKEREGLLIVDDVGGVAAAEI